MTQPEDPTAPERPDVPGSRRDEAQDPDREGGLGSRREEAPGQQGREPKADDDGEDPGSEDD